MRIGVERPEFVKGEGEGEGAQSARCPIIENTHLAIVHPALTLRNERNMAQSSLSIAPSFSSKNTLSDILVAIRSDLNLMSQASSLGTPSPSLGMIARICSAPDSSLWS